MKTKKVIKRRLRDIVRAVMGKPKDTIEIGVKVNNCDECERTACKDCPVTKNYRQLVETRSCLTCGKERDCERLPGWGETIRINCILWREKAEAAPETGKTEADKAAACGTCTRWPECNGVDADICPLCGTEQEPYTALCNEENTESGLFEED